MPKEQSPGKPTTRRYTPQEKAEAVRMVRTLARRVGDRARDGAAGRDAARVRGRVGAAVGPAGRHRRRPRARGEHRARPRRIKRARAGEPGAAAGQRDPQAGRDFLRGGARPPTQEVVAFIDANRDDVVEGAKLGVERICSVLQVAPSTYYAAKARPPSARAQRDDVLTPALTTLWEDNYRVYGARKLWKAARRAGHDVGRDQVARLMRAAGIEGVRRGPSRSSTTRPDGRSGPAPRPGEARLHRHRPEPAVGHRPHLRPDVGRRRLRLLHHRRLLPHDRRLAGRLPHAHRHGPRRPRDGPLVTRHPPRGAAVSQRRRLAVHVAAIRRAARRDRRRPLHRHGRRLATTTR